jgi:plasmid stability protein
VVLVNSSTASASEILSGALRCNSNSILMGRTTYGKGVVCMYMDFGDDTSLCVSSGEYLLPDGSSINEVGITPDVVIDTYNPDNVNINTIKPANENVVQEAVKAIHNLNNGMSKEDTIKAVNVYKSAAAEVDELLIKASKTEDTAELQEIKAKIKSIRANTADGSLIEDDLNSDGSTDDNSVSVVESDDIDAAIDNINSEIDSIDKEVNGE